MNIITHTIRSILTTLRSLSLHVRVALFLILCALGVGTYWYSSRQYDLRFFQEYAIYAPLAETQDTAAYTPGSPTNPLRIQMNQVLTQVLLRQTTAADRLALATHGLELIKDSEKQIDAITAVGDKVDTEIAKMQVQALSSLASSDQARQIIALAKTRASIISDIRAYSYRTDFDINTIFTRVVADHGVLTDQYVIDLNNQIPAVEASFNKRSDLYTELQSTSDNIATIYNMLSLPYASALKAGSQ